MSSVGATTCGARSELEDSVKSVAGMTLKLAFRSEACVRFGP